MNLTRIAILGVAAIAAGAAALLVRGMLGGGTPAVEASLPPPSTTTDVLVASRDIPPGYMLDVPAVRWESWPKSSVSDVFITKDAHPDIAKAVEGIVVRAPLVSGEPLTENKIVRAGAAGFLAATITKGKRAISIPITADTGAGGFILPNDRVDIILTRDATTGNIKHYATQTILRDVRVLAIDQSAQQEKDQKAVVGKTATLELTEHESELLAEATMLARQQGSLSLALRSLGDTGEVITENTRGRPVRTATVEVIRYGVARKAVEQSSGGEQ